MAGFSEVYTRDPAALQRTAEAYYKLLFFLVGPLSVGGALVGDLAVHTLYGPGYAVSGVLCQIFFLVFSVSFLSTPLSMVLYVVERPGAGLLIYLANAAVNVGLDLLLIPRYGVWGALVPVALVVLVSPLPYRFMLRRLGVSISIPWAFLGRVYAASALMVLAFPLRSREGGWPALLLLVAGGGILFLAGLRLFRVVGPAEAALLRRANPRVWNRLRPLLAGRGAQA
jgi:O-antigen/teichoic acid export membrane protein